ncbi:MAG: YggT family protein [Steroidobacteraceae bacterium]
MDALLYIVNAIVTFVVVAFLLRAIMPLVRADFRNPLGQAVLRVTDPLVRPLRRVLGPVGRVDVASLVAVYAVQYAGTSLRLLIGGAYSPLLAAWVAALDLLHTLIFFYSTAVIAHALLSWVAMDTYNPASRLLAAICEPLLAPVRRILPPLGGLDLSPLVVLVLLQAAQLLVR